MTKMRFITIRIMPNDEATYKRRKKQVVRIAENYSKKGKEKISLNLALNMLLEEKFNQLK